MGPTFGQMIPHKNQKVYMTYNDFEKDITNPIPTNATVLIKGSRGMKMERVLDILSI